ncbi:hypothetical protein NP493_866g01002 [Ridgeia piscesae]|uniref:Uncharacterized protein n=1 Tax=Ridgeia piscesae TaxID=27915 RepID=A0AAD9NNG6_RIDPI|nr:hypothetical protein NP493_866g01002 [Ridgeia piscesae]
MTLVAPHPAPPRPARGSATVVVVSLVTRNRLLVHSATRRWEHALEAGSTVWQSHDRRARHTDNRLATKTLDGGNKGAQHLSPPSVSYTHTHTPQKRCRHQSPDVLTLISSVDKLHGLCRSRRQAGGNERRPHVHCHDDVPAPAMGCRKCTSEFAIVRDTAMDDGPTYRCCERRALTHTYTY